MKYFASTIVLVFALLLARTSLAECIKEGGRLIDGQCYCFRTADDKALKTSAEPCPKLFGIELTFSNPTLMGHGGAEKLDDELDDELDDAVGVALRWLEDMAKICADRAKSSVPADRCLVDRTSRRIVYEDGFYVQVSIDDRVIELQARPLSHAEWVKYKHRIENDVFAFAAKRGLLPQRQVGGRHVHIDVASMFAGDSQLFLDFLVDFQNRPHLSVCALGSNFIANPPLALQSERQRSEFKKIVSLYRRSADEAMSRLRSTEPPRVDIVALAKVLIDDVFNETISFASDPKYQAINLGHVADLGTLEIRSIRPQKNWEQMELLMRLFSARIDYLKRHPRQDYASPAFKLDSKLVYSYRDQKALRLFFKTDAVSQACSDEFYDYVTGAGLSWDEYKSLLPDRVQAAKFLPTALKRAARSSEDTQPLPK